MLDYPPDEITLDNRILILSLMQLNILRHVPANTAVSALLASTKRMLINHLLLSSIFPFCSCLDKILSSPSPKSSPPRPNPNPKLKEVPKPEVQLGLGVTLKSQEYHILWLQHHILWLSHQ